MSRRVPPIAAYGLAALGMHLLKYADHRAAHLNHLGGLDQAIKFFCWRGGCAAGGDEQA